MASPSRWTKTQFLAWFEQQRAQLVRLTTALFGGELKAAGHALHDALVRSLRLRHYRGCRTTMEWWFLQDVKSTLREAVREAERTVLLRDDDPTPDDSTSGDDVGRIEYAVASDEVDDGPAVAAGSWGGRCPSLAPYVTGMGPKGAATAAEGC